MDLEILKFLKWISQELEERKPRDTLTGKRDKGQNWGEDEEPKNVTHFTSFLILFQTKETRNA